MKEITDDADEQQDYDADKTQGEEHTDARSLYGRPRESLNKIRQPIPSTKWKKKPLLTETT